MRYHTVNRKKRSFRKRNFSFSFLQSRFFKFLSLGIILMPGLIYLFIFSDVFKIKKIEVLSSNEYLKTSIQEMTDQEIDKNIFLLKTKPINTKILDQFPEILKLDIKRKMPDILTIEIKERQKIAVLCCEDYDKCFFIDQNGLMFKQVEKGLISDDELIIFLEEPNEDFALKKSFLLSNRIEDFLEIEETFKNNLKIAIKDFTIISNKRLNVKVKDGWEIYFNLQKNIKSQITKLRILLEKEIPIEKRKNLEYIDLRFERVFYK